MALPSSRDFGLEHPSDDNWAPTKEGGEEWAAKLGIPEEERYCVSSWDEGLGGNITGYFYQLRDDRVIVVTDEVVCLYDEYANFEDNDEPRVQLPLGKEGE